jgi:hypothetical protein
MGGAMLVVRSVYRLHQKKKTKKVKKTVDIYFVLV